jgi:hypothetical protein
MYPIKGVLMNNPKYLFIGLLLSASATSICVSKNNCQSSFNACSTNSCNVSCNVNVDDCSGSCSFSTNSENCSYTSNNCQNTNYRPGFILRPFTTDQTLENAVFMYDVYHNNEGRNDDSKIDFQAAYFHRSSRSKSNGAGLYLGKNTLNIKQDGTGDINSLWLGLANDEGNFSDVLKYNPTYKVDGAYFGARFDLEDMACGLWFSTNAAFLRLKNKMQLCGGEVASEICNNIDAREALGYNLGLNDAANNGQMFIDEIQFKLGYDYFIGRNNDNHVGLYLIGTAPTRRSQTDVTPDGESAYAHLISGRGSFGAGLTGDWTMWTCNDHSLNWLTDLKYRYIFKGNERRSFNLNNGPLSGAVLQGVFNANPQDTFSLADYLYLPVKVQPRSSIDLWTAMHYQFCDYGIELGYDFFYIQREKVSLKKNVAANIGILDIDGLVSSASAATVNGLPVAGDAEFKAIANTDLAFASVTTNRAMSHKFYLALSHRNEMCCAPIDLSVGGEYEYASKSQPMLSQWGLFIKGSMNF